MYTYYLVLGGHVIQGFDKYNISGCIYTWKYCLEKIGLNHWKLMDLCAYKQHDCMMMLYKLPQPPHGNMIFFFVIRKQRHQNNHPDMLYAMMTFLIINLTTFCYVLVLVKYSKIRIKLQELGKF